MLFRSGKESVEEEGEVVSASGMWRSDGWGLDKGSMERLSQPPTMEEKAAMSGQKLKCRKPTSFSKKPKAVRVTAPLQESKESTAARKAVNRVRRGSMAEGRKWSGSSVCSSRTQ